MPINDFAGNWTYRSFENNPEIDAAADNVLLATADLTLETESVGGLSAGLEIGGRISGILSFGEAYLTVSGTTKSGNRPTIRFRATGVEGTSTAGWIYDYFGWLTPSWPKGVEQRSAIVGTVIRTVSHLGAGGLVRPAGATLSFVAVLRDPAESLDTYCTHDEAAATKQLMAQ